jgi:hypothetical protein
LGWAARLANRSFDGAVCGAARFDEIALLRRQLVESGQDHARRKPQAGNRAAQEIRKPRPLDQPIGSAPGLKAPRPTAEHA